MSQHDDVQFFVVGERVLYVPTHAQGDRNHPDVERGVVTGHNKDGSTVFVRFGNDTGSKGCYPHDLQHNDDWPWPGCSVPGQTP